MLSDLIVESLPLVWSVIHSLKIRDQDREDCYSVGCLALVQAARNFDPGLGFKFTTYAWPCVRGQILNYLASQLNALEFDYNVVDPCQSNVEDKIFLEEILGTLSLDDRYFVELRLSGLGLREIGILFNVSYQFAYQKWQSIINHFTLFVQK